MAYGEHIKDRSLLWDQYVKEADAFDQDIVQGLSADLDALLIFAGLFSAINTAFIIESYQDLKPDPTDATNLLLRTIAYSINNNTANSDDLQPVVFMTPLNAVIVNSLYFASLSCSLFAAFGAVLAKQWLNEYRRTGKQHRSSYDRAHRRHIKYLGMEKYHSEVLIQALGTILQISVFLFLAGVVKWLWPINTIVASVVTAGTGLIFLFYLTTTVISILDHSSPFSTRVSAAIRSLWPGLQLSKVFTPFQNAQCMAWLRDNATTFESISAVANSVALLPAADRSRHGLNVGDIGPVVLRSIISDNAIPTGFSDGSLHSTLRTLSAVLLESSHSVHFPLVIQELSSILRFVVPRDESLSGTIIRMLEVTYPSHSQVPGPGRDVLVNYLESPTVSVTNRESGLSLLYHQYIREESLSSLSQEHTLALATGTPAQQAWQWKVAEALEATRGSRDSDSLRHEFRQMWALVFLQEEPTLHIHPCPLWTKGYIIDTVWMSKVGAIAESQIGLLVLLQYAWQCFEDHHSFKSGDDVPGLTLDLSEFFSTDLIHPHQIDMCMLGFEVGLQWEGNQALALAPVLWWSRMSGWVLARVHSDDNRKVVSRYTRRLWQILLAQRGQEWMASEHCLLRLKAIELFLATVTMTNSGADFLQEPSVAKSYHKEYLLSLLTADSCIAYRPGDYQVTERINTCLDTLATAFGIDVKRTREAFVLDADFNLNGEAYTLALETDRQVMIGSLDASPADL